MRNDIRVSVIIPCFNAEQFIGDAIESVLKQSWHNFELLIVDDASKDGTCDVVRKYVEKDTRIKLISLDTNGGAAAARNVAIDKAKGRYLAFLDSDDLWMPNKLKVQIEEMEKTDAAFSCTGYIVKSKKELKRTVTPPEKITEELLLSGFAPGCPTVIIDIKHIGEKLYMPNIKAAEDIAFWIMILRKSAKGIGIGDKLTVVHELETSLSSNKITTAKYRWQAYRYTLKLPLLTSIYYFGRYAISGLLRHWT